MYASERRDVWEFHTLNVYFIPSCQWKFLDCTVWYLCLALVMTNPPHEILCSHRLPLVFYGVKGFMLTTSPSITAQTQGWGCHLAGSTSVIYGANTNAILVYQRLFVHYLHIDCTHLPEKHHGMKDISSGSNGMKISLEIIVRQLK